MRSHAARGGISGLLAVALVVSVLSRSPTARAERPTDGGLWTYTPEDDVQFWDEPSGRVRVHYSVAGPSAVLAGDSDQDGVPDFAQLAAEVVAEVMTDYEETLGLRPVVSEAEAGVGELGGSAAFDAYLVDFAGMADGHFSADACTDVPRHCGGAIVFENDFAGYGYPSPQWALRLVAAHEMFHAFQAAYENELPVWMSEGTATWAPWHHDPAYTDIAWYGQSYLDEAYRTLYKPPTGPVPAFAYGSGLWFAFLTDRHGEGLMGELLTAMERTSSEPVVDVDALTEVLTAHDDTWAEAWPTFASWNLATGARAGIAPSYSFAGELDGVPTEAWGTSIDDDNRFYALSARYYRVTHGGGPLWFAVNDPDPDLHFALHAVAGGKADGAVEDALARWSGATPGPFAVADGADLAFGGYWLVVSNARTTGSSAKARVCLGSEAQVHACAPPAQPEPAPEPAAEAGPEPGPEPAPELAAETPTADAGRSLDAAADVSNDGASDGPNDGANDAAASPAPAEGGCAAAQASPVGLPLALALAALALLGLSARRRRS